MIFEDTKSSISKKEGMIDPKEIYQQISPTVESGGGSAGNLEWVWARCCHVPYYDGDLQGEYHTIFVRSSDGIYDLQLLADAMGHSEGWRGYTFMILLDPVVNVLNQNKFGCEYKVISYIPAAENYQWITPSGFVPGSGKMCRAVYQYNTTLINSTVRAYPFEFGISII